MGLLDDTTQQDYYQGNDLGNYQFTSLDDIITQYMKLELNKNNYPSGTEQSLQWGSYIFNSEPNKNKLPSDWAQRKNALLTRDHQKCFRCSKSININLTQIHMIRSLENGGKYFSGI